MSRSIEFDIDANGIALLRVNRPAARNALTWSAQEGFAQAVAAAARASSARALIVTGTGEAFVSGGDLKELAGHPEASAGERLNRVMSAATGQPVVRLDLVPTRRTHRERFPLRSSSGPIRKRPA